MSLFKERLEEMMKQRNGKTPVTKIPAELLVEYRAHAEEMVTKLVEAAPDVYGGFNDVALRKMEQDYSGLAQSLYEGVLKGFSVEHQKQLVIEAIEPLSRLHQIATELKKFGI